MTAAVEVSVKSEYQPDQSEPQGRRFVYSYTITLTNQGDKPAQLIARHWIITDAQGAVQEVQGKGVVGEQPHLEPGEAYTYTSGVVLETETGTMTGSYEMVAGNGETFEAKIPEFALVPPHALH